MFNLTKLSLLWEWVGELKKNVATLITEVGPSGENLLPSRSTATTGQILKLTGENKTPAWADEYSYTPPAFSETEVNTGKKWIDGKDIYCKVYRGTFPEIQTGSLIDISEDVNNYLYSNGYILQGTTFYSVNAYYTSTYTSGVNSTSTGVKIRISTGYSLADYVLIVYYTKPDPAPETRDDDTPEEPEEKKTTRKKTTK